MPEITLEPKPKTDRELMLDLIERNKRIEDKLARLEVSYIELLAKMNKAVKL